MGLVIGSVMVSSHDVESWCRVMRLIIGLIIGLVNGHGVSHGAAYEVCHGVGQWVGLVMSPPS